MKLNNHIHEQIQQAAHERRCVFGQTPEDTRTLRRLYASGLLISPYPCLYAEPGMWSSLDSTQHSLFVIRALARKYPTWVFSQLSAAAVHGLDYPRQLNQGKVFLARNRSYSYRARRRLRYTYMGAIPRTTVQGIPVTSAARTIVDCALTYEFRFVLPMIDAAVRNNLVRLEDVVGICDSLNRDYGMVLRLVHYADGASENGGESLCRGTMIEEGFEAGTLQVPLRERGDLGPGYRADFLYRLYDGSIIVVEFDGTGKYVDPQMVGTRTIRQVVHEEREREDALKRCGVTRIVRLNYAEVYDRTPMVRKLLEAGVPTVDGRWDALRRAR